MTQGFDRRASEVFSGLFIPSFCPADGIGKKVSRPDDLALVVEMEQVAMRGLAVVSAKVERRRPRNLSVTPLQKLPARSAIASGVARSHIGEDINAAKVDSNRS